MPPSPSSVVCVCEMNLWVVKQCRRRWFWCFRLIWTALVIDRSFVAGHFPVNLSQDIIYMRMTYPDHLPHG